MPRLAEDEMTVVLNIRVPATLKTQFFAAVKKSPDQDASKILRAFMRRYISSRKTNVDHLLDHF